MNSLRFLPLLLLCLVWQGMSPFLGQLGVHQWVLGVPSAYALPNPRMHADQQQRPGIPEELQGVGVTEKLGGQVSIQSLNFKDESGQTVVLSQYFSSQRPVLLNLVYYDCPNLCSLVLNGMLDSLKGFDWTPGNQFDVVTVSIDPREKPDLAGKKKAAFLATYGRPQAASGWHFLTGEEPQIRKLADEVGFGYKWDEAEKQYAHSAVLFILTPEGKISRYLYGISYSPKDLKLSLVEASNGKVGTIIDRIMLYCYRYNPTTKKYSIYLTKIMQAAGGATVLIFGGYLALFWRRQRKYNLQPSAALEGQGG